MNDQDVLALQEEVEQLIHAHKHEMSPDQHQSLVDYLWNMPTLGVSELLRADVDRDSRVRLPDDVVARLWEIGYLLGADRNFLVSDACMEFARPERTYRPPQPVRYPLKGGGHGAGRGIGGKAEWPARWSDDDAMFHVMGVAREPDGAVTQPDGTFRAWGVRDGVDLRVIVTAEGDVETAYPISGDGVVTNPIDDVRAPYVERLQRLVAATELADDVREGMDELMAAGEWDQVLLHLRALPTPDPAERDALSDAAGIRD